MSSDATAALADDVAAAVRAVEGVADLHAGVLGEVGTYLPGRRVPGIRLVDDAACEIHVTVLFGHRLDAVVAAVREAVRPLVAGAVHVVVEDVVSRSA